LYRIGQHICLWFIDTLSNPGVIRVTKEVMVTITEEKTGVPGEISGKPIESQSLRGIADDGTIFEKHWESWPESQTSDYISQWSADNRTGWDIPFEAFRLYNEFLRGKKRNSNLQLIGPDGNEIKPKGDNLFHCEKHDRYELDESTRECFYCRMENRRANDHKRAVETATQV